MIERNLLNSKINHIMYMYVPKGIVDIISQFSFWNRLNPIDTKNLELFEMTALKTKCELANLIRESQQIETHLVDLDFSDVS